MIEHLLNLERRFGEPEYSAATEEIIQATKILSLCLNADMRTCLEKLTDSYIRREQAVMEGAFRDGFCQAALLMLEISLYHTDRSGK